MVAAAVPGSEVTCSPGGEPDARDDKVDFSKIHDTFPGFVPAWKVQTGIAGLVERYERHGLTMAD